METNKITESGTNLHLSMIADNTKLLSQPEKISVNIQSDNSITSGDDIIENFSNDSDDNSAVNINNNDSASSLNKTSYQENNNFNLNQENNNFHQSNSNFQQSNNNFNQTNNIQNDNNYQNDNNNFQHENSNLKYENYNSNVNNTNTDDINIDANRFNIDPDTIPFHKLDPKAQKFKKMEKLAKLIELKNRGFNLTKNYSMESNYEEMCFEVNHWTNYQTKKDGIELSKSFLMNAITGIEFLNDRYDPFGFKLNGWSEQVKVNSDNYNDVFAELYDKYKSTGKKVEPEIKLILMLTASAVTFHASKSIQDSMPGADFISSNILNGINSKINNSLNTNEDTSFSSKQSQLYETIKKQQQEIRNNMNKQEAVQTNSNNSQDMSKNNISNILNNLKSKNNYNDESSEVSISSSVTLGSEKKKILKIDTKN